MEKGRPPRFELLEDTNRHALRLLRTTVDSAYDKRDRERCTQQMVHFHLKNAEAWNDERTRADLTAQVDPHFVLGEGALGEGVREEGVGASVTATA